MLVFLTHYNMEFVDRSSIFALNFIYMFVAKNLSEAVSTNIFHSDSSQKR